jgi:hypothetical protein
MTPHTEYTIISPQVFNAIPDIHDQVDFPTDPAFFTALSTAFQKHNVYKRFRLHLLHRHFVLPENCVMLKSDVDADISLMKIAPLDSLQGIPVRGLLYFLNDTGSFQAYEYEQGDAIDIPPAFLEELSTILLEFKMEKVIALDVAGVDTARDVLPNFEYVLGDTATVTVQLDKKVEPHHRQTGFTFLEKDGKLWHQFGEVYAEKKNTHQVFYDGKCRLPSARSLEVDPSEVRRILILNGILAH